MIKITIKSSIMTTSQLALIADALVPFGIVAPENQRIAEAIAPRIQEALAMDVETLHVTFCANVMQARILHTFLLSSKDRVAGMAADESSDALRKSVMPRRPKRDMTKRPMPPPTTAFEAFRRAYASNHPYKQRTGVDGRGASMRRASKAWADLRKHNPEFAKRYGECNIRDHIEYAEHVNEYYAQKPYDPRVDDIIFGALKPFRGEDERRLVSVILDRARHLRHKEIEIANYIRNMDHEAYGAAQFEDKNIHQSLVTHHRELIEMVKQRHVKEGVLTSEDFE